MLVLLNSVFKNEIQETLWNRKYFGFPLWMINNCPMNCEEVRILTEKLKKEPNVFTLNLNTPWNITKPCLGKLSVIQLANKTFTLPLSRKQGNKPSFNFKVRGAPFSMHYWGPWSVAARPDYLRGRGCLLHSHDRSLFPQLSEKWRWKAGFQKPISQKS